MRHRALCFSLLLTLVCTSFVSAQRSPSPGVGNAVLLATNSIQMDRDTAVLSGDVIVNNATAGAVLGEKALSLDRNATTPAGYKIAATSIDLDQGASAGGDAYYNTLTNDGTIAGALFTPLALPVFTTLPAATDRPAGSTNVVLADNALRTLDEGAYGDVVIGKTAKLTLRGGSYAFRSITVARGGELRYSAAADVVVNGRAEFGSLSIIAPTDGFGLLPAAMRIQINGTNGSDGGLLSTPPAFHIGQGGKAFATIFATSGSLILEQDIEGNGAFLARDILVGRGTKLTINSAFNQPPTANAQVLFTTDTTPLLITLAGSDPEDGPLTFSIVSGPTAGTLSPLVPNSPNTASITYTPTAPNVADSFTFRVRDHAGATGDAVITINPTSVDAPPANPTTVLATAGSAQTTGNVAATLVLRGSAPTGVALTFSIISGRGPSHGSLGDITQGSEVPQRSATIVYTPAPGYVGSDTFDFKVCGVIASNTVCDNGTFSITVLPVLSDAPTFAHDVEVSTSPDTPVVITLGDSFIQGASRRTFAVPLATILQTAAIAGNVADADNDGLGDNANALPGATPIFMSAGVNQSGGAGSNGTVRMQFEWDLSNISGSLASVQSAQVLLPTHRGTIDSLDTSFYWVSTSADGNLTNSDFESPARSIAGVVMPVPADMPAGADGTFTFSVLDQLRASSSFSFFAIQGRVDERSATSGRGLEVRTTASGNVTSNAVPTLALTTSSSTPLAYRITSLPVGGMLRSGNQMITAVPFDLQSPDVSYIPNSGFAGLDTFTFSVSNGVSAASALAKINVVVPNCTIDGAFCYNGR